MMFNAETRVIRKPTDSHDLCHSMAASSVSLRTDFHGFHADRKFS